VELPDTEPAQWAIRDVAQLVLRHFGLAGDDPGAHGASARGAI
jgi:hypothetical protein